MSRQEGHLVAVLVDAAVVRENPEQVDQLLGQPQQDERAKDDGVALRGWNFLFDEVSTMVLSLMNRR